MQNNWVILQGRLCHKPNYSATRKGLHKVAFRLAVPRPPRTAGSGASVQTPGESDVTIDWPPPPIGSDADYVTVIIIGRPAYEFQQLDLQAGAPVRVQGRLRSWDKSHDDPSGDGESDTVGVPNEKKVPRRDYRIEVIAEKVDPIQ